MPYFGEPVGRVKIQTTSKNSQRYYTTKRLIRDLLSNTPNCYHVNVLITAFLTIFRRFPTTFRRFPKIFQNCPKDQTNVLEHFPRISENFRIFPNISEDCRRLSMKTRRCFDDTPTNLSANLSNRSSGVQIPRDICTRFGRYLYSTKCSWIISNGNRTEWSPIRSVIIRVITKSDDRAARVRFVYHEYDYRPELDDTKSYYQLIIKITISEKRRIAKL